MMIDEQNKELLKNHFALVAIYTKQFINKELTKKEYIKKTTQLNLNTYKMLDIE